MKSKAILMALAMMTTALAGCTGTDGVTEVDEDALNELIQGNLQDFINNTTVVVNQDFHYHNNTTIDNTDNSVSNVNGSGVAVGSSFHVKSGSSEGDAETIDAFSGVTLMHWEDGISYITQLSGWNICVQIGSEYEADLQTLFASHSMSFTSIGISDMDEAVDKFSSGECMAVVGSASAVTHAYYELNWSDSGLMTNLTTGGNAHHNARSSISISIEQSDDELLVLRYAYGQIYLDAICNASSTGCTDSEQSMFAHELSVISTCGDVSIFSSWEIWGHMLSSDGLHLPGTGMSCTHDIQISTGWVGGDVPGYDSSMHNLSFGDWTYSILWENFPVTIH